jgi:hypothetical protein
MLHALRPGPPRRHPLADDFAVELCALGGVVRTDLLILALSIFDDAGVGLGEYGYGARDVGGSWSRAAILKRAASDPACPVGIAYNPEDKRLYAYLTDLCPACRQAGDLGGRLLHG